MVDRDYAAEGIVVHWDSERCAHSEVCWRSLPEVFEPGRRPWIDPSAAGAHTVAATIDACPSGALRYTRTDQPAAAAPPVNAPPVDAPPPATTPSVFVTGDGPYVVDGSVTIRAADGSVLREVRKVALCRCGHSGDKPFCDGSHRRAGFSDPGLGSPSPPAPSAERS